MARNTHALTPRNRSGAHLRRTNELLFWYENFGASQEALDQADEQIPGESKRRAARVRPNAIRKGAH
ncbi:MAG TPA: hypothetical protein VMV45_09205 [Casimicrobiaceae bacterium]|nr:hypothetical protein [Casimicrobiaceae bacterium]